MSLELCRVVLVRPHYPGNIGAAARVMRNFGLSQLVLVDPLANIHDRPAQQMSAQGQHILDHARVVPTLDDALADCVFVAATSARQGGLFRKQSVGAPRAILPSVADTLASRQPAALVFGPEPTGLANADITRCHALIHIHTDDAYPALNLAQAVAICVYELHAAWTSRQPAADADTEPPADFALLEHTFAQLRAALEDIHFLYGPKADSLMHAVRHLLARARPSVMETKILLGLARQIRWVNRNASERPPDLG